MVLSRTSKNFLNGGPKYVGRVKRKNTVELGEELCFEITF